MRIFSPPNNLWRDGGNHIWVDPIHMPYKDITPPRNWRHKKFECSKIHIWSWWRSPCSMTHGKIIPAYRRKNDQIWTPRCNMIHHIPPSRSHDDSQRKGDIHIRSGYVFTNQKRPTGGSSFGKWNATQCVPSRSQESVLTTKLWARFSTRAGSWSAQHTVAGRSLR